jgi:hypothetical protein
MYTVNPELIALAKARFEKRADGMPMDPAAMGAPPADPSAMGAAPPMDPAAMGAVAPAAPADPATAMAAMQPGGAPPAQAPMAPATPTAAAGQQKLKPEQMMQMLDYRLYNMQQQLTAIMNAMGVQVAPESLVLPPGTTGAPPAETALPGGPMAPPPPAGGDPAAQGGAPVPAAPPGAMPPTDPTKAAWWQLKAAEQAPMHVRAAALKAVYRSLDSNAD